MNLRPLDPQATAGDTVPHEQNGDTVWDTTQVQDSPTRHPAVTVETVASRDERHHGRHTKRSGGVKTSKLGAVQRRVLMRVFILAGDKAVEGAIPLTEAWVPWKPKQQDLMPDFTPEEASSLSKALVSLEGRRLLMVRRHEGGRAYAVRLTVPGYTIAMELLNFGGQTIEQKRDANVKRLDANMRAAAPVVQRELRRSGLSDERRARLQRFADLYDLLVGDPEDRGTGNYVPGINWTLEAYLELREITEHLVNTVDTLAHLRS